MDQGGSTLQQSDEGIYVNTTENTYTELIPDLPQKSSVKLPKVTDKKSISKRRLYSLRCVAVTHVVHFLGFVILCIVFAVYASLHQGDSACSKIDQEEMKLIKILQAEIALKKDEDPKMHCGEVGGGPFDDRDYFVKYGYPTRIDISAGKLVDGIRITYGNHKANWHGNKKEYNLTSLVLGEREWISGVSTSQQRRGGNTDYNEAVCSISFIVTDENGGIKSHGPYGSCGLGNAITDCGNYTSLTPLKYIKGMSGSLVDQLLVYF